VGLLTLFFASGGCDRDTANGPAAPSAAARASGSVVHLTTDEVKRAGIDVATVRKAPFTIRREFPASVQANENELAEVTTLIRGRVVKVAVDVGKDVKKGELLALLHSTDLGEAQGAYLKTAARGHEAQLAYERAQDLHQERAISLAELQRREAEMKTARAEAREAAHRLELLGVPEQEIRRLDREQTIHSEVPIRAPFPGRVIMRNITRGEVVETQQKLFTVADLSDVWVVANVPEKDVAFIRPEQQVDVVLAAYPHAILSGKITYVGDVLDPATRTMRVRVTVANPDRILKPEMFAVVRVYAVPARDVPTIPLSAVQNGGSGKMVFVRKAPEQFEARVVAIGDEQDETVSVLEGLQEGEEVVVKGAFALKSEMEIHKIEPAQ
jgi:cobalt-zinc-cadmium efflux system membrane fusion protein